MPGGAKTRRSSRRLPSAPSWPGATQPRYGAPMRRASPGFDSPALRPRTGARWLWRAALVSLALGLAPPAGADPGPTPQLLPRARRVGDASRPWGFTQSKPVELLVVGGSIAAYLGGGYPDLLAAVCPGAEVVNLSRTSQSARAQRQVLEGALRALPRRARPGSERWLLLPASVNSVAAPEVLRREGRKAVAIAHRAGWRVLALGPSPWGRERDGRWWRGLKGLQMARATEAARRSFLGPDDEGGIGADFAVDPLATELAQSDAELRPAAPLERELAHGALGRRLVAAVRRGGASEAEARAALLAEAQAVPRRYLRPEYHSFDSTHPNFAGHKILAAALCPALPAAAACDCAALPTLQWSRRPRAAYRPPAAVPAPGPEPPAGSPPP